MKTLACTFLALLFATHAWAGEYTRVDNRGHKTSYEEAEGDSAIMVQTFAKHDWDLTFTLGAGATNDGTAATETALAGFAGYLYLGQNSAVGVSVSKPDVSQDLIRIQPKAKLYAWRDPSASWNKGFLFAPLSWNVATGSNTDSPGGTLTVDPTLAGFVEWPLGFGAFMVDAGIGYVLTQNSQDVPDGWGTFQVGGSFVWWFVR